MHARLHVLVVVENLNDMSNPFDSLPNKKSLLKFINDSLEFIGIIYTGIICLCDRQVLL